MPKRKKRKLQNYLGKKEGISLDNLGRLIAEDDKNLKEYYIGKDRYVAKALDFDDPTIFFIGPKGIGKSAILQMVRLENIKGASRIINISPDDLAFSALTNVKIDNPLFDDTAKGQWLFKSLWDYVLLMELWELENHHSQNNWHIFKQLFKSKDEKRIRRLFEITISDEGSASKKSQGLTSRILELIDEVEISGNTGDTNIVSKAKLREPNNGTSRFQLLNEINYAAKTLPGMLKHQYHVLIDDLDLYWTNQPIQNSLIAALFYSLRRLSDERLKFAVAIRQDIYDCLPIIDKDKSRDRLCNVEWDLKSVKEMIERRLIKVLGCKVDEIWGKVLPKNGFKILAQHSTKKPREIIRATSLAITQAIKKGHYYVELDDLNDGIRFYSEERLTDLASEYQYIYRDLAFVFKKFKGKEKEFPFNSLSDIATELAVDSLDQDQSKLPWAWAGNFDQHPEQFARVLLDIGFLLIKANRTAPPEHYDPQKIGRISHEMWFAVHPMYSPGLQLLGT